MTIMDYVNKVSILVTTNVIVIVTLSLQCTVMSRRVSSLHSSDTSLTSYKEVSIIMSITLWIGNILAQ